MKEVLESRIFNIVSEGPEIEVIKKLIDKINENVESKYQINEDDVIDWESDFGRRIFINNNCAIRTWDISNLKKGKNIVGVKFRISLFYDE